MSDETEHEHTDIPENCNVPGCCFHTMMNAKVRTLTEDGENYVNVHDVAVWLVNWHAVQMAQLQHQMLTSGIPPHAFKEAVMNNIAGATSVLETLHDLAHADVATDLTSKETVLVVPAAMKDVPDTVPTEWTQESSQ